MKLLFVLAIVGLVAAVNLDAPVISQELINEINSGNHGWKAVMPERFDKMSMRAAKHMMGVIPDKEENLKMLDAEPELLGLQAPDSFDARDQWPECPTISEIRDQSTCGSCWAFGAAEAWSDRVCIGSKGADKRPRSTHDLLSCCGFSCGYGCNGGQLSGAWSYIKSKGLVTGDLNANKPVWCADYPFPTCDHHIDGSKNPCGDTQPTPACPKGCNNSYVDDNGKVVDWSADKLKASTAYSVSGEAKMMEEIMTYGPIEGAFTVYSDFLTYKSGVYKHVSGSYLGGHAIKVLGWGEEDGQKYWLIANSWNPSWGDNGYFKILRGSNECGIESGGYAGRL